MLDHVAINVQNLSTAKAFYERALEPLGYSVGMEVSEHVGFRSGEGELDFWLSERPGSLTRTGVGRSGCEACGGPR